MKRKFSLILALAMILACFPWLQIDARAEDTFTPLEPVTQAYVNPIYASVLDESDLVQPRTAEAYSTDGYYTSVEEAAAYLRSQMTQRSETIVVNLMTESLDDEIQQMMELAVAHTGVPTEGDYLQWQYGGWTCGISGYTDGVNEYLTITFGITYYTSADQESWMDSTVSALLAELNVYEASDYEKLKSVYDWLAANVTYDYDNLNDDSYKLKHTAYAALANRTSVCQGYAVLLYRMLLELGIDNRVIVGIGNGGGHAWNIVKLDEKYYNVDATWDAIWAQAGLEYQYFLRTNETFGDHIRDMEYDTPKFNRAYPMADADYVPETEEEITHVPGDINGDDGLNNKDVTRLFQYLSGYDVEINETALDINDDGAVNNKDLTRLFQYLSGWDVEIN